MNDNIIREIAGIDYRTVESDLGRFLKGEVEKRGSEGAVLGLSGGVDSAVTTTIAHRALGGKALALVMPDTEITPREETEDALHLVDGLGIEYKMMDIRPIVREYSRHLEPDEMARGNLRARVRAGIIYYYANAKSLLVLGSSDRSEWLIGYFTKFGDGAADLLPLAGLYKLQVRGMAEHLKIPREIIRKKSSPHLVKGHVAEEEIGLSYEEIDAILYSLFDKGMTADEAARACEIKRSHIDKVLRLHAQSRHKREAAGIVTR